jgi:hypothetical protein
MNKMSAINLDAQGGFVATNMVQADDHVAAIGAGLGAPRVVHQVDDDDAAPAPAPTGGQQGPMRWTSNTSGFVLRRMAQIISEGSRTDKTYKDKDVNAVAKALKEYSGLAVSPTQVYNHLRKWKQKCSKIARLKDLSGAAFDHDLCAIMLEQDHFLGHCKVPCLKHLFLTMPFLLNCVLPS